MTSEVKQANVLAQMKQMEDSSSMDSGYVDPNLMRNRWAEPCGLPE